MNRPWSDIFKQFSLDPELLWPEDDGNRLETDKQSCTLWTAKLFPVQKRTKEPRNCLDEADSALFLSNAELAGDAARVCVDFGAAFLELAYRATLTDRQSCFCRMPNRSATTLVRALILALRFFLSDHAMLLGCICD